MRAGIQPGRAPTGKPFRPATFGAPRGFLHQNRQITDSIHNQTTNDMKTRIVPTALVLALAGTLTAAAQDGDRPQRERRGAPPEVIEKFDKDGDGQLNEEERKAAMEERRARMEERRKKMLAEFDKDGDGKLNEEERKAAREAMEAKREELLEKYDADKDGRLSPEERKAAIDAGEDIPRRPMRPGARGQRGEGRPGPGGPGRGQGGPGPQGRPGPGGPGAPDA